MFVCSQCTKPYVGRTVTKLSIRTNQHRSAFHRVLKQTNSATVPSNFYEDTDDIYSLGLHLINDHGCSDESAFDINYRVLILQNCSPMNIEINEHKWIHKLKSLRPLGINRTNPFSIPLL